MKKVMGIVNVGFYCMEDLVPKDYILKKSDKSIDFSFIYDLVKDR